MKASGASLVFEQKAVPFESIDAFFEGLRRTLEDGFVLARSENVLRYFFVIQGKPYVAAVIDDTTARVTSIEEFFLWFRNLKVADIEVYKADKKVLLCLLVRINYNPELSFTTDQMTPEEVIENMEAKGKDAVIAVSDAEGENDRWHFVIFVGGKVAYTTLLTEAGAKTSGESPADRLISYIMGVAGGTPLLIELYIETKIIPAADAKPFEEGSICEQYLGLAAEAVTDPATAESESPAEPESALEEEIELAPESSFKADNELIAVPESVAEPELVAELEINETDTFSEETLTSEEALASDIPTKAEESAEIKEGPEPEISSEESIPERWYSRAGVVGKG